MPIEFACPSCHRKLRLADEHAGQEVRCPACEAVSTAPAPSPALRDPTDEWLLITPEGYRFGPVPQTTLVAWVAEGRVDDRCDLCCVADGVWRRADVVYPALRPREIPTPLQAIIPSNSGTNGPLDEQTARQSPLVIYESRGGLILALGIVSWATGCPIFGILAWIFGSQDLAEIDRGTMDPSGRGWTEAGRWIGMLHTFLALIAIVVGGFAVLVARFL